MSCWLQTIAANYCISETMKQMKTLEQQLREPHQPVLHKANVIRWSDADRLRMIDKSEFYSEPRVYQYGYYDGYQIQKVKTFKELK